MTEMQRSTEARTLWIEACRSKMIELDPKIGAHDASELAEALWNRTSLRALGAIATALGISSGRRFQTPRDALYER